MINVENLKKSYNGRTVVDIPSLTLKGSDIVGLTGRNGAGKTTLLRLMLALTKADTGCVLSDGIDVARSERWKDFTGAFLDDSFLPDFLTPTEYFRFIGRLTGLSPSASESCVAPYAALLEGVDDVLLRHLSAGYRQKTVLVAALMRSPRVMILDEPFTYLDAPSCETLTELLRAYIAAQPEALILLTSHDAGLLSRLCTRCLVMEGGRLSTASDR